MIKGKAASFHKIYFHFIITLEIVRYKLLTTGKITDSTADAISRFFAFDAHHFYHLNFVIVDLLRILFINTCLVLDGSVRHAPLLD
jgi:hypothetical protein